MIAAQRKNIPYTSNLLPDYIRFFMGEENLPILHNIYLSNPTNKSYPVNGYQKWNNLVRNQPLYYPFHEERAILLKFRNEIQAIIGDAAHFVSFGTGTQYTEEQKTVEVMKAFSHPCSYTAWDLSQEALDGAATAVKKAFPDWIFPIKKVKEDIFSSMPNKEENSPELAMILGCTIANFESGSAMSHGSMLTRNLVSLASNVSSKGYMLIGYDRNRTETSLLNAYDNKEMHELMLTSLHTLSWASDISNFNPFDFKCEIKWQPEFNRIGFYARPTKKQMFSLNSYQLTINQDNLMHIGSSYKVSEEMMRQSIKDAKIDLIDQYDIGTGRMAIALVQKRY
jgi:uncharacterized SAM-dependent methyltransferase